ncbi:FAD-dependent oxidoreductase [Kineosporia rhizophila]|uniref:FAD-dependent oxidoreductase n=1 Tax=Kineosporia TaxID=49184 RepID=UPI001E4EBB35|nr:MULTISPECIES: FAD-dependent oxidoreductase [Kineosporia]MCE0534192.1 FAD-dependent oxidoreductase [Kineosporia rhizophila]GLY13738.1 NADPH-ferredoxin reductase FprA [Kineosporia sp. NBRC 101677]
MTEETSSPRPLRIGVIGAGPAGIYAADILTKSEVPVEIDVLERLPAPYGLVRYGVAPDHPRIKEIIKALRRVLDHENIRFIGNVNYGTDLKLEDLRAHYDAVIFATGAFADRDLDVPGTDLPGSFGAADFVNWYDGHPDVPREWPLTAQSVAVLGAGNVALDVARVLSKTADEMLVTEIPDNVYQGLKANQATDVHVFARRGPVQVKFSPLELRELAHSPNVDVVVHPEGFEFDEASMRLANEDKHVKQVMKTLNAWVGKEPTGKIHRLHLHFLEAPVEISGDGKVENLRTERMELTGDGNVRGTGQFTDWPVQAVYRAVGYRSSALPDIPFDHSRHVISNDGGRVLDVNGNQVPGVYCTGWIKRGPIGLIGHTKSDANETVQHILKEVSPDDPAPHGVDILAHLELVGVDYTTWDGWNSLDAHEVSLGEPHSRERIKVVEREDMIRISKASPTD